MNNEVDRWKTFQVIDADYCDIQLRETMWQVAVLYSAVFFTANHADGQSTCVSDAPDNCTFAGGLSACKWPFESNDWNNERSSAAFGASGSSEVNVTSRTACGTGNETHCLQIRYLFNVSNTSMRVLLIRVRDEDDGDDSRELVAWNETDAGIGVWHTAGIPIQSKANFNITVEARKFTQVLGRMFINSIHYIKAPCLHLPTSTVPSPLTNTQKERTTTIGSHVSTDASNNVGVVVGVVVAVVVIVVAVSFFILYRRKRLHMWKTCFINKNEKNPTGTSHSGGEHSIGKYDKRAVNGVNATPTVSGHNNHAFTASESQPSDTYYSVIKDTDGSGDSAAPHYSTIQEFQSADGRTLTSSSKLTDDDPYEIEAENGHLSSRSAAARYTNSNANLKGKTSINGNHLPSASDGGNKQAPADYSLARGTGGEATGVYHYLEEDPNNHGEEGATGLYHYTKDSDMNSEAGADATGVYHILEEDPAITRENQLDGVYRWPADGYMGQQKTSAVKVSKGHTGNYNTLDLAGKNSGQKNNEDASGGVYNHLNAGNDDPYNEVDREKRAEVFDDEYSHIK